MLNKSMTLPVTLIAAVALFQSAPLVAEDLEPQDVIERESPHDEDMGRIQVDLGDPEEQLPLDDLRRFTEVFERIKRAYVEEVSDRELLEKAIKGMLSGLDPHSAYLDQDAFSDLEETTRGEFGGLGIEVGTQDGFVRVIAPIDGTPAHEAGIQAGDLIVQIDDTPVKGLSLEEAVSMMRGEPGTTINLTITREGENQPIEIEIERAVIQVVSVRSRMLEPGYGYVRISQFQQKTGEDFRQEVAKLLEENEGPLKGMILDMRNNPGGVLQAAVEVSDALLDDGLIVYTEGRIENSQLSFNAEPGDIAEDVPLVVLINSGSASASEIVAGALQDHRRAVVMGTDSFGKGSVQTVMPLGSGSGIKLTTARYFTPEGRSIQAKGISPDIQVRQAELRDIEGDERPTEADLRGHLGNGERDEEEERQQPVRPGEEIERDYQLRSALNLLKGMDILDQRRRLKMQPAEEDKTEEETEE